MISDLMTHLDRCYRLVIPSVPPKFNFQSQWHYSKDSPRADGTRVKCPFVSRFFGKTPVKMAKPAAFWFPEVCIRPLCGRVDICGLRGPHCGIVQVIPQELFACGLRDSKRWTGWVKQCEIWSRAGPGSCSARNKHIDVSYNPNRVVRW